MNLSSDGSRGAGSAEDLAAAGIGTLSLTSSSTKHVQCGHMDASLLAVLNDTERLMVAETESANLAELDEDASIELETGS